MVTAGLLGRKTGRGFYAYETPDSPVTVPDTETPADWARTAGSRPVSLIGVVGWIVWLIAAISILLSERYPEGLWNFQRGLVRWQARLLGYLASLLDPYPPFSLDTGPASESAS